MRRILPEPAADATALEQVAELRPWESPPAERPRVLVNFALTLDGRATIDGTSGAIGSEADTAMLVALRTRVDAVMIGGGTMRAERYGRVVRDPAKRERREQEGLAPEPLVAIVSGRLDLPWDSELFSDPESEVVVYTSSDEEAPQVAARVEVVRGSGLDLSEVLGHLRRMRGVRALLCEGGATLHGAMLEDGLVDEVFVTTAAAIAGGEGPGLVAGLGEERRGLQLAWLLHEPATGELFARYLVA